MAREKSAWERMREKDEARMREEAEARQKADASPAGRGASGLFSTPPPLQPRGLPSSAPITPDAITLEIVQKAEVMMEQITNLYQMFIAGQERTPPVTQRKHLEDLILKIQASPRAMKATQFQVSQFLTKYASYRDRWEKLIRDIESGKVPIRRRGA